MNRWPRQQIPRIDWSNPLTRGLVSCITVVGGRIVDLANPARSFTNAGKSAGRGLKGRHVQATMSGGEHLIPSPAIPTGSGNWTYHVLSRFPANAGNASMVAANPSGAYWSFGYVSSGELVVWSGGGSGFSPSLIPPSSGWAVLSVSGNAAANQMRGIMGNGAVSTLAKTIAQDMTSLLGDSSTSSRGWPDTALMLVYNRTQSDDEMRRLQRYIWQIFEPVNRTIPLVAPVAAAASDGNSVGTSTASAVGTATASASGASTSSGAATGVGQAIKAAAGSANAAGTASAASTSIVTAAGASSGVGFAAAVGLRTASAVGNSFATGAASGVGVVAGSVGASVASGAASGVGLSTAAAPGIGSASSTASASGQSIATGTGSSIATGSAAAVGSVGGSQGSAAGTSTASGAGQSTVTAAGGSAATGTAAGVGQSRVTGAGVASATSLASAVGSTGGSQGYSGAQSAASGDGQSYVTGVAMSAGFGVAVGAGSSIARAGGLSMAVSSASGISGGDIDLTVRPDRMIHGYNRARIIFGYDRARIVGAA